MTTPRAADRDRVEPGPTPIPRGDPPAHLNNGIPLGFEFRRAVATVRCWMLPCPSCGVGWVPLVPDGTRFGYQLAGEVGCSGDFADPNWPNAGCEPEHVAWWFAWKAGELPSLPELDDRQRAYARGAVKNALAAALKGENPLAAARDAGRFATAAGYDHEELGTAFAVAAGERVEPHQLLNAILIGAATPGRIPS
jgi:hypothetical protein